MLFVFFTLQNSQVVSFCISKVLFKNCLFVCLFVFLRKRLKGFCQSFSALEKLIQVSKKGRRDDACTHHACGCDFHTNQNMYLARVLLLFCLWQEYNGIQAPGLIKTIAQNWTYQILFTIIMKIVMDLHASFSLTSIASLISFQRLLQINLATIREYWVWDLRMYPLSSGDLQLRS